LPVLLHHWEQEWYQVQNKRRGRKIGISRLCMEVVIANVLTSSASSRLCSGDITLLSSKRVRGKWRLGHEAEEWRALLKFWFVLRKILCIATRRCCSVVPPSTQWIDIGVENAHIHRLASARVQFATRLPKSCHQRSFVCERSYKLWVTDVVNQTSYCHGPLFFKCTLKKR
jgi:hypothetical protein